MSSSMILFLATMKIQRVQCSEATRKLLVSTSHTIEGTWQRACQGGVDIGIGQTVGIAGGYVTVFILHERIVYIFGSMVLEQS